MGKNRFTMHLPENVIPYVRQAIINYRNGQWFNSFGWDEERSGNL